MELINEKHKERRIQMIVVSRKAVNDLEGVLAEYEKKHGAVNIEIVSPTACQTTCSGGCKSTCRTTCTGGLKR